MRGFLEKWGDGEKNRKKNKKTEKKQKKNRDKTEFIGPIPPVGVGPKKLKF